MTNKLLSNRIDKLQEIQSAAVKAWADNGYIGTLNMCTGSGKTITSFQCLYRLLDEGKIKLGERVAFCAETNTREKTLYEEAEQYARIFGRHPARDFKFEFACYQAIPTFENVAVAIFDEIHDSFTTQRIAIFQNDFEFLIGLSATIPDLPVNPELEDSESKIEACERLCPIVYTLSLEDAIECGIASPYEIHVHDHKPDNAMNFLVETKSKSWTTSEIKRIRYLDMVRMSPYKYEEYYRKKCAGDVIRLIQNLPSKIPLAKSILEKLEGKTVVFALKIDYLAKIVPEECIVHGGRTKQENNEIIDKFNRGDIHLIGSCQKLRQGITLHGVTNCLIVSYYKKDYIFTQMLGRVVRFVPEKTAQVHIIRTKGTLETKWFAGLIGTRNITSVNSDN